MTIILYQSMLIMVILAILTIMLNIFSKKMSMDREKSSPFECGFDPKNLARLPFSLQFFLIALIFIIFDVELTLLLPSIIITEISNLYCLFFVINLFIFILLIGLFHEKNQGSLNWEK
uniref:NADH-ubiquinone oxidoreductase chain 3 n=1 Tax=Alcidodes juglans TaxID=2530216 RepID=A0A482DTD6_9CUCU|nr:NADH dehydrogenase subunit 3 [Alcidodes juglans]QBM10384.1 NADH dehydrogenase subunit 3 [Alcidodes juglans]